MGVFSVPLEFITHLRGVNGIMKSVTLIKAISLLIFLVLLITTTIIITEVVLGYSGFQKINGRSSVITLAEGCQQAYTNNRYGEAVGGSVQICFILALATLLWSAFAFYIVIYSVYCRRPREQREETRIEEQLQSRHYQRSEAVERYRPQSTEIILLYLFLALLILSAYVPFNFYLQLILHARGSTCQMNYNFSEVLSLTILSLTIMSASLLAFLLLLVLAYRFRQRMKMLELENGSESIRRQVDRIIRDIPESERRFYEDQRRREEQVVEGNREGHSESRRSQIKIEQVPQVQSVIYKANPDLMLQSVNVNPQG